MVMNTQWEMTNTRGMDYLNPGYCRLAGVRNAGWKGYDDRLAARVGS